MTNNQLTAEQIENIFEMAVDAAKRYGASWDSALVAGPNGNFHAITSDTIQDVIVQANDDSRGSSWLCDYLESVSPAVVIAALRELQERRKAASEPVAFIDKQWTLVYYVPPMSMGLKIGDKLYRHAQQPVAQEEIISELEQVLDWILNTLPVPTPLTIPNARRLTTVINACRAAMLQTGNSPVISVDLASGTDRSVEVRYVAPPGYVMVPKKLTAENGAKAALLGEFNLEYTLTCHECFGEGCEDCNDEGRWINSIPVDWTTIKAIWAKAVEHFVATQQEEKSE